ncbi:hypothetical protein PIB30_041676 [Stylosanthes scabra]|uniref:Uncharacterized protein n=1 Tax=Stylosanthes scabra TaxID=79078 RepID=A0ABU6TGU6_9FABA|nr:hypothetical protein [Stylosanthes scabra]
MPNPSRATFSHFATSTGAGAGSDVTTSFLGFLISLFTISPPQLPSSGLRRPDPLKTEALLTTSLKASPLSSVADSTTSLRQFRKGDYFRYLAEFQADQEKKEAAEKLLKGYEICA